MTMFYSGTVNGFFDSEIHGDNIPGDAVEITIDDYNALLTAQSEGWTITADAGGIPRAQAPVPPTLDQTKAVLCAQIDDTAEAAYGAIGSNSPGRLAEYQQAKSDAFAFQGVGYAGDVPATISCWAQAQGWTPQQACDDILSTAAAWEQALISIRTERLLGKSNVSSAADYDAAHAAADIAVNNILAVPAGL